MTTHLFDYINHWDFWLAFNSLVAIGALAIDRIFGEFLNKHHPVSWIGRWITWFEKHFYKNTVIRGVQLWLTISALTLTASLIILLVVNYLPLVFSLIFLTVVTSTLLAHKMLHDSVQEVANSEHPQKMVKMLVSRDCQNMKKNEAYKAAVETYAENLSDGVVAPWFYLIIFGIPGILLYKAINTMDSMVGYRNQKYENFGKCAAICDDIANYIPARITAIFIMLAFKKYKFWQFYTNGKQHLSPNAGHPITAIALGCNCQLGGPTVYDGKLKAKATFGPQDATKNISPKHIHCALQIRNFIDMTLLSLSLGIFITTFLWIL
ncbi:adenosylcobinamide-phosphate synthase CbiB [Thiomicrorhabdus indica]|uniref:adenosylcobinamide-phosphate synthase CbiB n=1 Tax=Thiomicrorhabdus indica TaxID=2267253 RepID=UPI00102DD191|nr:adenosylcobinamide-phosphate synthase CbiB [Thiomicrorhabdus indica]